MFARKVLTGGVAGAMTVSVIALTAGSASAVYTPDPNVPSNDVSPGSGNVLAADFVGVGSDTTEGVVASIARAYNEGRTTGRLVTYASRATSAADPNNTVPVEGTGEIARPRGSGGGLGLLNGSTNETRVDFARSSREINPTEISAQLQMFPFAKDVVRAAVQSGSNYAPANLSGADLVRIYSCNDNARNWTAFNGANQAINPVLPSTGSGTRDFFLAQLKAANSGVDVTLGGCVLQTNIQEHDPAPIVNNAGSVAPFSEAKSKTVTGREAIRLTGGFAGERAVYNVVRADVSPELRAIFGPNGFLCGTDAGKTAIEAAGFERLLPVNQGGVCGQQTQTASTNLLTRQAATATAVTVTSASASSARIVARVTSSNTPSGTVSFFEGGTQVAGNVPVAQGQAVATPNAAPGSHTYRAVFTPAANSAFIGSEGVGTGTVAKASSGLIESFPGSTKAKVKTVKGKKKTTIKAVKGSVTVTLAGSSAKGTGTILVKRGSTTVGTGSLAGGVATFALKGLKKGNNGLTATWGGDANASSSTLNFSVKVSVPKKKKKK